MSLNTVSLNGIDDDLQRRAEEIFRAEGRTAAEVYSTLLLRTVEQQHTPSLLFEPNQETTEAMRELDSGGGSAFSSVHALMHDLNADD